MSAYNTISSTIFSGRRIEKGIDTQNVLPNWAVASGQVINAARGCQDLGYSTLTNASQGFLNRFENISKQTNSLGNIAKGIDYVSHHINPFIAAATAIHIVTSDDKEKALATDGVGLLAMFAGEKAAKTFGASILDLVKGAGTKYKSNLVKDLVNYGLNFVPQAKSAQIAIKGILFVAASIGSWALGSKAGEKIYKHSKGEDTKDKKNTEESILASIDALEDKIENTETYKLLKRSYPDLDEEDKDKKSFVA